MSQTDTDAPRCARHPKTVTYLKCAKCGTPICPDCFVESPVGYKCRDCGRMGNTELYKVSARGAIFGSLVGLLGGMLAGGVLGGFWGIFIALIYGRFLGTLIMKAAGHKMGLVMDIITGASIIIGGLAVRVTVGYFYYAAMQASIKAAAARSTEAAAMMPPEATGWMLLISIVDPFSLIAVVLVAAAAMSRLRFDWGRW